VVDADSLDRLLEAGFPRATLALYGRWWQLETWLRELVYTELRAKLGLEWESALPQVAASRAERDEVNRYMASADSGDVLAYLDFGYLLKLIDQHSQLFEPCLPSKVRWLGMAEELSAIRHRVAHVRRPHRDDLARLEQALRDLDHGARTFYAAYAASRRFEEEGPVASGWSRGQHPVAKGLLSHAEDDTLFKLRASARPWAPDGRADLGEPGALWHAEWYQFGSGETDPVAFWDGLASLRGPAGRDAQRLAMHVLWSTPGTLKVTFAAVDEAEAIADAIGVCFDVLLMEARPRRHELEPVDDFWRSWKARNDVLPGRVQIGSVLSAPEPEFPILEP
jgi:Swt1-like HEPN